MKRWISGLINFVLIGGVIGAVAYVPYYLKSQKPYNENNQGVEALYNSDFDTAIGHLKNAIEMKPGQVNFEKNLLAAYNSKAIALSNDDKSDEALKYFDMAFQMDKTDKILIRNYGATLNNIAVEKSRERNFDEAQQLFEKASVIIPLLEESTSTLEVRHNYAALLTLWGSELMKHRQVKEAKNAFLQSLDLNSSSAVTLISLGDLGYEENDYALAKKNYSAALALDQANSEYLTNRLDMIEDEKQVEGKFKELRDEKNNFFVQYIPWEGKTDVKQVLAMLDEAYDVIGKELGIYPARTVNVKIYDSDDFVRISKLPEWAIGIFDGKLRLKATEAKSSPEQVKDLLFHEYTHAVLAMNVKQAVPAWFHEGIAQLMEPQFRENMREQQQVREALARNQMSFESLNDSFKDIQSKGEAENAYLMSKYFLLYLNRKYGHEKLIAWITKMVQEEKFENAFEEVYEMPIKDAQQAWIKSQAQMINRN